MLSVFENGYAKNEFPETKNACMAETNFVVALQETRL